jgi:hypothetical protein
MIVAETVVTAALCRQMVAAQGGMAEIALAQTLLTTFFATRCAIGGLRSELATAGALVEALQTIGFAAAVALVKAGSDQPSTLATDDQAVGTETLAGGGTDAKSRTVLLATWATNGTISTNERMRIVGVCHRIGA